MAHQQAAELTKLHAGSFDNPTPFIVAQFSPVLVAPVFVVLLVRRDQLDSPYLQPLQQWVRIIGPVGNHPFRLLPRTVFGPPDTNLGELGFRKRNFSRRGTFKPEVPSGRPTTPVLLAKRAIIASGTPWATLPARHVVAEFQDRNGIRCNRV